MKELGAKRDVTVCSFTHEPTDMPTSLLIICVIVAVFGVLAIGTALLSAISERRNPPIGTFMECNGVRLHYIERGNPAAPSLSVEESVVFGHSWGASVALALALYKRGSVRALILASGYYFPTMRLDFWLLSGPALPILGDVLRYTVAPLLSLFLLPGIFRKLFAPRAVPAEFKRDFPSSLCLRPKQLRAAAEESALLIPAATRLQFQYGTLTCPVRLIHGDSDRLIETAQSISLHSAIRNSNLQIIERAGHMVHYADLSVVAASVEDLHRPSAKPIGVRRV